MALNIPGLLGGIGSGVQSGFQNMNQGVNNYFSGQGGPAGYDPQDVATARNQSLAQMAALFLAGAQPMSGAQRAQYIAQVPMVGDDYRKNLRGMRDDRREEGSYNQAVEFQKGVLANPAQYGYNPDQAKLVGTYSDPVKALEFHMENQAKRLFPGPKDPIKLGKGETLLDPETLQPIYSSVPSGYDADQAKAAEDLRKEFQSLPAVKTFGETQRAFEGMLTSYNSAENSGPDQGIHDVAMVYSFFKSLDPASTVREGEFASVGQSMGLPAQLVAQLQRLDSGGILTTDVRKALVSIAQNRVLQQKQDVDYAYTQYENIATQYGIDPKLSLVPPRYSDSLNIIPGVRSVQED